MTSVIHPAATVIIARDGDSGLEILMIERAPTMGFAGGALAFPGGKVDPADHALTSPALEGFAALEASDAAARIAAAREAFEETGILLSRGPPVPLANRQSLRRLSDQHALSFGDLLARLGHRLAPDRLKPFARWLPPPHLSARFDTAFFVAALPAGETVSADGHEAVSARFARPADLLAAAEAGAAGLLFPTLCNLHRLAGFATVAALLDDETPPPTVSGTLVDGWLTIPEGLGYPVTRQRLQGLRRE